MIKVESRILAKITIGFIILVSACSKDSTLAPENKLGKFSVKSFDANAEFLYRPTQEDSAIKITWSLFYELQNQPGTIESLAMSFGDTLTEVTTLDYIKPNQADSLFEFSYNTWINSEADSLLFDLSIQGVFWNYNFQSDEFSSFGETFNWSKNVRLKIQK